MSLVADMKVSLRIIADDLDVEVEMLVGAALADMRRVGVRPELLELDDDGNLVRGDFLVTEAVACFVKSRFGYDNADSGKFEEAYRRTVVDLMNSTANVADTDHELPPLPEKPGTEPADPDAPANGEESGNGGDAGEGGTA